MTGFWDLVTQFRAYLPSLRDNGQLALAIFLVLFAGVFFIGAYRKRARIARARAQIPFTVGGWGTRGKSGTERLKAAVFHGLGYEVSVKTTGCEAMLIHSVPDEPPHEIFIFRSYDKSTIWEQRDLLETAAALKSEVFLWECMALQPEFVQLLQNDWMRDNYVTLTNAFPDHEDVQGPAGADVAECIACFIPYDSKLFTSEISFLPLFKHKAKQHRSLVETIEPHEGDLIAEDLLALFPYNEHPRNIALVAALSEELGLDRNLAIATMAEHVVPDLGVLKAYPPACVRGRVLQFINGMSANERTGFLNNWDRMDLADKDVDTMPGEAIITVVNNRWDRVSRSEVFARIMVEDAVVDAHVLIGTNLRGLRQYVDEALRRYCDAIEVVIPDDFTAQGGLDRARSRLATLLARVRIAQPIPDRLIARVETYAAAAGLALAERSRGGLVQLAIQLLAPADNAALGLAQVTREVRELLARVDQMLVADPRAVPGPEVIAAAETRDVVEHIVHQATRLAIHARLAARIVALFERRSPDGVPAVNEAVRSAYRELFLDQLVTVEDSGETGDQIIDRCARAVPPGTRVAVMGIQNIKGTGLDFVYRWLALDQTTARLHRLDSEDPETRRAALRELESFEDYGIVDTALASAVLAKRLARSLDDDEAGFTRTALARVRAVYDDKRRALAKAERSDVWSRIISQLEALLDPLDSVRRRRRASNVMRDLIAHRISHGRAAKEMRSLYDRQGGGWLLRQ
jgi:gamma-polyglutamate synthase